MSLKSILGTVANVAGVINPAVGQAISIANKFLPKNKRLPEDATGQDVIESVESLPPGKRADAERELVYALQETMVRENTEVVRALAEVDKTGASTRPFIARGSFLICAFVVLLITSGVTYTLLDAGFDSADQVLQLGIGVAALLSPFVVWVNRYFGLRTREKESRAAVTMGQSVREIDSGGLFGKIGKMLNG